MTWTLIIQSGKHKGSRLVLSKKELVIGREKGCGIRLSSTDVSRRHCQLVVADDGVLVEDLKSRNGTFINGDEVKEQTRMGAGDRLQVGPMEFLLWDKAQAKKPKPPTESVQQLTTEDDIASWLAEQAQEGDEAKETMVLPRVPDAAVGTDTEVVERRSFASLAEEAADIFRRHFEKTGVTPPDWYSPPDPAADE